MSISVLSTSAGGGGGGTTLTLTNSNGSDLSGNDGAINRTLVAVGTVLQVFVDMQHLHLSTDYSMSGSTITFLNAIYDSQKISVYTT